MENVTQAVQDELVKSLDYKLGSSNPGESDVSFFFPTLFRNSVNVAIFNKKPTM